MVVPSLYVNSLLELESFTITPPPLENPQRYLSKKIGSRKQQTMFYWTQDKNLIVCGCFKNTLIEFEQRVEKIHGDNDYGKKYQEFINTCKLLMEK